MSVRILVGDALSRLREMPDASVQCCVTSPPYWGLRAYKGDPGMIGLEPTFAEHVENLLAVFREVRRVLRPDGTLWLNYGDAYAASQKGTGGETPKQATNAGSFHSDGFKMDHGLKPKDLLMMPARLALALQADGWWLRSEIVWHKPNPMPESVTDRPTSAHEKVYLLAKSARYFYDADAVRTEFMPDTGPRYHRGRSNDHKYAAGGPGNQTIARTLEKQAVKMPDGWDTGPGAHGSFHRDGREKGAKGEVAHSGANLRNVWTIPTAAYSEAHFATFPEALVTPCVKAGSAEGTTVLDPFAGSGTVGLVAAKHNRSAVLIEISPEYAEMARRRIHGTVGLLHPVSVIGQAL